MYARSSINLQIHLLAIGFINRVEPRVSPLYKHLFLYLLDITKRARFAHAVCLIPVGHVA